MRNNRDRHARTKQQNQSDVWEKKAIAQAHPTGLTDDLLKIFEARPPLEFKPPSEKRKCPPYTGMAQFVSNFAEKGDPEYQPPVVKVETGVQKKARIHKIRLEEGARKAAEELEKYDPHHNPDATGDPYKTLFVSKLNYETSESRIKREFEAYGPIKRVKLVVDKSTSKPRGYAFIEYVHTRDMKAAYKQADGKKIDGRRVMVDVERGRTVPNWRPRRLGGGLGTSRISTEDSIPKVSVRESGRASKSQEPRTRGDRNADRRKSLERERQRERSRERFKDWPRDREYRGDRHHRDRERPGDSERTRERDRESRRDRDHERGRHYGKNRDLDRERPREDYDEYSKHDRDRHRERDHRDHDYYDRDRGQGRGNLDEGGDRGFDLMEFDDYYERATFEHGEKKSAPDMDQEY